MKIFVYGTLKLNGRLSHGFDALRGVVKPATIKGAMYSVHGSYPAVVLSGNTEIKGELHQYDFNNCTEEGAFITAMDRIEGYNPNGDPKNNLYNRVEVFVTLTDGSMAEAMMYVFNRDVSKLDIIADGYWPV